MNRVEKIVNNPLAPFILCPFAWVLMWFAQLQFTSLEYAIGVSVVFLPAGVRTLAVFVFGFRGAVGVFIGSLATAVGFFKGAGELPNLSLVFIAFVSAIASYLAMVSVCRWKNISTSLEDLSFNDVLVIVFSQGILSATLHQFIFLQNNLNDLQEGGATHLALNWSAMACGDIVGSMIFMLTFVSIASFYMKIKHSDAA